jgi:preprotein translocase subunit SecD
VRRGPPPTEGRKALEKLTAACLDRQVAIVIGGEVVTTHKVRQVIRDSRVQITGCAEGGRQL